MIELKQLSKTFPTPSGELCALRDINLSVQRGEIFGVIGKSGAGKSTLIRCINLLEKPSSGSVFIDGQDLTQMSAKELRKIRGEIGMIFQHFNLLPHRTVLKNVGLPLELSGFKPKAIQDRVMPLLEMVGLADKTQVYPNQLSGGQKQRVAIARALATHPKILLCDEMTSALDPETTRSILELIHTINQQLQLSIFLITHEMQVIKLIADRVAVLDKGAIIENADVFTLFTHPKTDITKSFIRLTLPLDLPKVLTEKIHSAPFPGSHSIWRFAMSGQIATQPIINYLLKTFPVQLNILQANLEFIHHQPLGVMIVAIEGSEEAVGKAKKFLENKGLTIEVIGYVGSDDWLVS